ncbi:MAG: hypothetical protein ACKOFC_06140 [Solirubrobacterales bacterium]
MIVLLVAAAIGVGAILFVTQRPSDTVRLRDVTYDQVQETATQLQQLIRQNTR